MQILQFRVQNLGTLAVHAAFKTVSNAIELAMIASSTALMQACKREAPSARVVRLNKCSAEVQKGSLCQQCKDLL